MRHVAPHRWAEAAAGRVGAEERARMAAHAGECERCATARARVLGARAAFGEIAKAPAPELRWETIGARVYWSASQERRLTAARNAAGARTDEPRPRPRRLAWLALPGLALAATAAWIAWPSPAREAAPVAEAPAAPMQITPIELVEVAPAAPALPVVGLVTLTQGDARVAGVGGPGMIDQPVVAGLPLATGEGRLAVQVDAGTAFAIGPRTRLEVARLDTGAIELHVDGEIAVEVARRAPGQRFVVVAGGRAVEVRGTAFEVVHHAGRVEVRCRHGVVAVRDVGGDAVVEVGGGQAWAADAGEDLLARAPAPLDDGALAEAAERAPVLLPAWTDARALVRTTGALAIAAPRGRAVRIDGVAHGRGAMTVRVMSGRHLVEADRAPAQWIATRDDGPAEVTVAEPAPPPGRAAARRRAHLERSLDMAQVASCLRELTKQGLAADTFVVLEIGVDETGAISFLNVGATDLPRRTAACVRDQVAKVRFPAGAAAAWDHRLQF